MIISYIKSVSAKSILNSRKEKTIEVSVNNQRASSPSGKSTGKYESKPYKPTLQQDINTINKANLSGLQINSFQDLKKVEKLLRKKLGANSLFALESAILKALALSQKKELWQVVNPTLKSPRIPIPLGNAIGGGLHSHNKCPPTFQEFLIIPENKSIKENVKIMNKIYKYLKRKVKSKGKNDEGAWQTSLNVEEVLEILSKISGIRIGIDVAASSFYKSGNYYYTNNKVLSRDLQINYINSLIKKYKIFYVEDPLQEEDFSGFSRILKGRSYRRNRRRLVSGDDLTATHLSRTKEAIKQKSMNAMIIKPNQNGSLLDLAEIFKICKKNKIKTILSHRSGETLDNALADLAVGFQADFIKTGISGKVREVKLRRLIQIEKSTR